MTIRSVTGPEDAAKLVAHWRASGYGIRAFCGQNRISEASFRKWLAKLGERTGEPTPDELAWAAFEILVRECLVALGYHTERNCQVAGLQVDLLARVEREFWTETLIVECKSGSQVISNTDVAKVVSAVAGARLETAHASGMIVHEGTASREARLQAQTLGVRLVELDDLVRRVFDARKILAKQQENYENSSLRESYVDLSCKVTEQGNSTVYKPVEVFLDTYIPTTKRLGAAVLGNFGSGKTSLCQHYAWQLGRGWLSEGSPRLYPVYLRLRDLQGLDRLFEEAARALTAVSAVPVAEAGLRLWTSNHPTLFILDGLDELAAQWDRPRLAQQLRRLFASLAGTRAKVLITCRTHFFKTVLDEGDLGDLLRLYVLDWGREELNQYLEQRSSEKATSISERIRTTYDLTNLSKTPLFLDMIVGTIESLEEGASIARLYSVYTDVWINAQNDRARLTPEHRRLLMQNLAARLYESGTTSIVHSSIRQMVRESFPTVYLTMDLEDLFATETRTATFLVRDDAGNYFFRHKSFLEYFLAARLAEQLGANDWTQFSRIELNHEVSLFLSSFFERDISLFEVAVAERRADSYPIGRNVARTLRHYSGARIEQRAARALLELMNRMSPAAPLHAEVVRALAGFETAEVTDALLAAAAEVGGEVCLEVLGSRLAEERVRSLYCAVLEREPRPPRISACLRGLLAASRAPEVLRALVPERVRGMREVHSDYVAACLLHADFETAVSLSGLKSAMARPEDKEAWTHCCHGLGRAYLNLIDGKVPEYRRSGDSRQAMEGRLYSALGHLVPSEYFKPLLDREFGSKDMEKKVRTRRGPGPE